jgi:peptidoglycan glycosyltransferase
MAFQHPPISGVVAFMALPDGSKRPREGHPPSSPTGLAGVPKRMGLWRWTMLAFVLGALLYAGIYSIRFFSEQLPRHEETAALAPVPSLPREDIHTLLADTPLMNRERGRFEVARGDKRFLVNTTLSDTLQQALNKKLDPRHARIIAIVAMTPSDGRVIGLAGFDRGNTDGDICFTGSFPAASIIKIVTAAAAVDNGGLSGSSVMTFNGQKHTLYRSQLKQRVNRYSNRITLSRAFAESVNPVFGKLGMHTLGAQTLQDAANRFGFNRDIPLEKPVFRSRFTAVDDAYHLAELASGFNRDTRVSALHGALMAAAVINDGKLPQPRIVDDIYNENGRRLYAGPNGSMGAAVSPEGAAEIKKMMRKTVKSGTCRKIFHPYRRDRVLSRLVIGGKSGSIDNRGHDARYDWFVGFAMDKNQGDAIAVAAVVAHHKYIGVRAGDYARTAIKAYFKEKVNR